MTDHKKIIEEYLIPRLLELGKEANGIIRKRFLEYKLHVNSSGSITGEQDIVTELDHTIGQLYINGILENHPELTELIEFDSEEEEERKGEGRILIRFDPIDGTKYLVRGIPFITSSLVMIVDGEYVFGMVPAPFMDGVYHAVKGKGAYFNDKRIKVSDFRLNDDFSFVFVEHPVFKEADKDIVLFDKKMKFYNELVKRSFRVRNIGLGSLALCLVADGAASAYLGFVFSTKIYDIEAGVLIAEEAGAEIVYYEGGKIQKVAYNPDTAKKTVEGALIVANPRAMEQIRTIPGIENI